MVSNGRCDKKLFFAVVVLVTFTLCNFCLNAKDNGMAQIKVMKIEENIYILSNFSEQYNVLVFAAKGSNRQISYRNATLVDSSMSLKDAIKQGGIIFHRNGDDATPWNINGTYIGGNHGCSDGLEINVENHGLVTGDLGSEWKDDKGHKFYVMKIKDKDHFWLLSENTSDNDIWKFRLVISENALTRESDGKKFSFEKPKRIQLHPACRIQKQEYLVNGKDALKDNVEVACDFLDIVETYDIIAPDSLLESFIKNPGKENDYVAAELESVITSNIKYQFQPNAACVETHECVANRNFKLGYMGFIQSAQLIRGDFEWHDYYIPQAMPFDKEGIHYDFVNFVDYREKLPKALYFSNYLKNISDPQKLPDRFMQFIGKGEVNDKKYELGYVIGYSLIDGCTRPEIRAKNCNNSLFLYVSNKTYPSAIDRKMGVIKKGQEFKCVAYRQYFYPEAISKNATACYWHKENDSYMLYAHYHKAVENDPVTVPEFWSGKDITVVDKTDNMQLLSEGKITGSQVLLSNKDKHGYIVLRIK